MTVLTIIFFILCVLMIWVYKETRVKEKKGCYSPTIPEHPVLKVWGMILLLLGSLLPVWNLLQFLVMLGIWIVSVYGEKEWICPKENFLTKIIDLLNKPIG